MSSTILPRPAKGGVHEDEGAAGIPPDDSTKRVPPRSKTTHACQQCRSKRRKCTGERPSCKACRTQGVECNYVHDDQRLRAVRHVQAQHQQERIHALESTLTSLKTSSEPEALERLRQLRAEEASTVFESPGYDSGSSRGEAYFFSLGTTPGRLPSPGTLVPEGQALVSLAHPQEQPVIQRFDVYNLPPRPLIEIALTAFIGWSSWLSPVMTLEECHQLISELYDASLPVEACLLSEITALAALGSLQLLDQVADDTREVLFSTAHFHLDQCRATNQLRATSIEHCLEVYRLKEKSRSEDASIAMTLQLTQWTQWQAGVDPKELENFRRYYRTLQFLERVLSTNPGQGQDLA